MCLYMERPLKCCYHVSLLAHEGYMCVPRILYSLSFLALTMGGLASEEANATIASC